MRPYSLKPEDQQKIDSEEERRTPGVSIALVILESPRSSFRETPSSAPAATATERAPEMKEAVNNHHFSSTLIGIKVATSKCQG